MEDRIPPTPTHHKSGSRAPKQVFTALLIIGAVIAGVLGTTSVSAARRAERTVDLEVEIGVRNDVVEQGEKTRIDVTVRNIGDQRARRVFLVVEFDEGFRVRDSGRCRAIEGGLRCNAGNPGPDRLKRFQIELVAEGVEGPETKFAVSSFLRGDDSNAHNDRASVAVRVANDKEAAEPVAVEPEAPEQPEPIVEAEPEPDPIVEPAPAPAPVEEVAPEPAPRPLRVRQPFRLDPAVDGIKIDAPAELGVGDSATIRVSTTLRNDGAPGDFRVTHRFGLTGESTDTERGLSNTPTEVIENLTITCNEVGQSFVVSSIIFPFVADIIDLDESNNFAFERVPTQCLDNDIEVTGMFIDAPNFMVVGQQATVTLTSFIRNNGPSDSVFVEVRQSVGGDSTTSFAEIRNGSGSVRATHTIVCDTNGRTHVAGVNVIPARPNSDPDTSNNFDFQQISTVCF